MNKESRIILLSVMLVLISGCKSDRPGTLKWKYKTGGPIVSSPAIGHDGTVYITSMDSCLYAFDPEGNLKWKYQADDMIWSSPAIGDDGTVYFSSRMKYTYALTPEGELKWKYLTYSISSPAIGYDGTLCVTGLNGKLFAITPEGELKWVSSPANGLSMFPPVIGLDGTIYCSAFSKIYAFDSLGNVKWFYEVPMNVSISALAIDEEGNVCFCTWSRMFYVLTPQGELRKSIGYPIITSEWTSPAIDSFGTIYFGGGFFYALNPDYTKKWMSTSDIIGRVEFTSTIGSDGTIYIGAGITEGCLYALTSDGEVMWKYKIGAEIRSSPAIGSDGTVYVGSTDSCFYAIRSDSKGLASSPWPKFQHDNQNTGRAGGGI